MNLTGERSWRPVILLLAALAFVLEVFGYWGLNTVGGRAMFDEMAGIIPFASQVLGGLFALGAVLLWRLDRRRRG